MSNTEPQQDRSSLKKSNHNSESVKVKLIREQKPSPKHKHQTFHKLKRNATDLFNQNLYSDDHFKLQQLDFTPKTSRKISIMRLSHVFPPGTLLFGDQINFNLHKDTQAAFLHFPGFICEMHSLPFWHYESLIEPKYVNEKGFYHVVIYKDGRLIKETIDDTFYFDELSKILYTQFIDFKSCIWMHLLVKVWAKCKGGYNKISSAKPFDFIQTFFYPDWKTLNPALQDVQKLIQKMNCVQKGEIVAIAETKKDPNVGLFGLIQNSAGYLVTGHYMEFEAVFIKVRALNGSKWNGLKSIKNSAEPQDKIWLEENQFLIPIKEFTNLFRMVHLTTDKFHAKQNIFYTFYSLNLDARQSKAKMILIEVNTPPSATESTVEKQPKDTHYMVNLSVYFPFVRSYDLSRQNIANSSNDSLKIPFCKLMFGRQEETTNLEASFVESMKQMMLQNQDEDFLYGKSSMQYEWVEGTYFKGYGNTCTFLLNIKPGRYLLRFKMQTLRVQYRANINIVSLTQVKISDPKMDRKQQQQFLKQILSSKARLDKRNIGYLNPIKKGSWYICNNDFSSIGYGYFVIQTIKTSEYQVELKIDLKALKSCGYKVKQKKFQVSQIVTLKQGQGYTLILKILDGFQGRKQMIWPPQGISISRLIKN